MLTEQAATMLNVLVGEYLQTATPVASNEIARTFDQKISSASVPNTMARLTEEGYISQPHVSSGGVHSDLGYRFYVESLPEHPRVSTKMRKSVDRDLAQTEPDIGAWSKRCAAILSNLKENLPIVTAPRARLPRLKRIHLVFLQESTALLVLILEEARLLRKLIPFGKNINQLQLDRAASRLNDSLGELNCSQMQSNSLELNQLEEHYTDGLRRLLSQPEFSQGELARQLVQLVEGMKPVEQVLNASRETEEPAVFIGSENQEEFLNSFGVIMCNYGIPQSMSGTICVIGPKRMEYMEYVAAIGGVRHISAFMSQMVLGIQRNVAE